MTSYRINRELRPSATRSSILAFIERFSALNGYPPSVREIAQGVGLRSTATVAGHIERLREAGLVTGRRHKARALTVTATS